MIGIQLMIQYFTKIETILYSTQYLIRHEQTLLQLGKEEYLYSASLAKKVHSKRWGMDHTVLPANNTMPAFPSWAFTTWHHHSNWGSLLLIYRPRKDERLRWPSWLTYSGWFTHISGHPSATGRAQDSESTSAKDRCSTAGPRNGKLIIILLSNAQTHKWAEASCQKQWPFAMPDYPMWSLRIILHP